MNLRAWVVGALCAGMAGSAGYLLGTSDRQAGLVAWATSVESRYAGDVFCYAPSEHAQVVLLKYREQLEARRDDSVVWKREHALLASRLAALAERSGKPEPWREALLLCRHSGAKICTEDRLKQELTRLCPSRSVP